MLVGIAYAFLYQELSSSFTSYFPQPHKSCYFKNAGRFSNKPHRKKNPFSWRAFGSFLTIRCLKSKALSDLGK